MITRRDFIKTMSLLSGAVLAPVRWLGKWAGVQPAQGEVPEVGELYAGFVLLPEGAPMPAYVRCAPAPMLCQVNDVRDPDALALRGETLWFDNFSEWISKVSFTTYILNPIPVDIEFVQGHLIRFAQSGEEFAASIDYGPANGHEPLLSISARPIFPRPYPIWPVVSPIQTEGLTDGVQDEMVMAYAEKVDFTPTPGLMLPTEQGHLLYWIKQDILYTLVVEYDQSREAAMEIVQSLVETTPNR